MDISKIIGAMTLKQKIDYCTGADMWHTKTLEKLGVPAIKMSDGPHGLRCQENKADFLGINKSVPATCFPTAVTAGATWNRELFAAEGAAIGAEGLSHGVSVVLGPGCNIKRNPLCGRNFEYISEDPYVAGQMAAAFIRGQQSTGAGSSLKHFAANSQEYKRQNGDSQIDPRTLREIYLPGFETAVKEGRPATVMCAYNQLNGVFCSDHKELLTDILRTQWGFDGLVVTDWGAMNDTVEAFRAGCDLNMPGGSRYMHKAVKKAVEEGRLSEKEIDTSVERILRLVERALQAQKPAVDSDAHHNLALQVAQQGAVLLKNEAAVLPLQASDAVLIGYMAQNIRYQGAGSSHINPTKLVALTDVWQDVPYIACCDEHGEVTDASLAQAAQAAAEHKIAVVVAGLPERYESEAFDREHMQMPRGHNRMIEAVAQANPNTVVVLLGGGVMELPWEDQVKAVLYMGLPGQAGGQAIADLLTGAVNPSGKLTESWPYRYEDVISKECFGQKNVQYREGIYVGYRYYDKAKKPVRYPFGYGLSYTTFAYSDLTVQDRQVSVTVENTGTVPGAEVVQLYVAAPQDGIHRPEKELKDFARVELAPGEKKTVQFLLNDRSFALWNDGWVIPGGTYGILIGASSRDIRCSGEIRIAGETVSAPDWQKESWYETLEGMPPQDQWKKLMGDQLPASKENAFTLNSTLLEMKDDSWVINLLYKLVRFFTGIGYKKDGTDPAYRMMVTCTTDCPVRNLVINGKGIFTDKLANWLVRIANGRKGGKE